MAKKYGTMKCSKCGRTIRYKTLPKYVKGDPNRLIAIRRHYSRFHPREMAKWHKGIKHADAEHPKKGNPKRKKVTKTKMEKIMKRAQKMLKTGVAETKKEALARSWEVEGYGVKVRTEPRRKK